MSNENFPYALYKMVFRDGNWQPITVNGRLYEGIIYAETVNEGLALDVPDPDDVYGVWTMTTHDHVLDNGEYKIRKTKPLFLVSCHPSGCLFTLEDTRWTTGQSSRIHAVTTKTYASVELVYADGFYVPELAFGIATAASEHAAAQQAQGGADVPSTGFGVWEVPSSRSASSCVETSRPDALYVAQCDGSLQKEDPQVISTKVRSVAEHQSA